MNKKKQILKYLSLDILGSAFAWFFFNLYRKNSIESEIFGVAIPFEANLKFFLGLLFFVLFWVSLFGLVGFYHNPYHKSRLKEFGISITTTLIGSVVLFFILIIDDYVAFYHSYYHTLAAIFLLIFLLTYTPRAFITSQTIHRIHKQIIGFPTLIIGCGNKAQSLFNELNLEKISQGFNIIGFINPNSKKCTLPEDISIIGNLKDLPEIVSRHAIEEIILALDNDDPITINQIINSLTPLNLSIRAIPGMNDILLGRVKLSRIIGTTLVNVSFDLMPTWQANIKELLDYLFAIVGLVLSAPIAIVLALIIKFTSKGPIIFKQERIGQHGKPFKIYKFRSMYIDAEANGPALSNQIDPRVTPIGRFMRKTRLDEIPNFINVLKGEMSIVGPRPERKYYSDQIVKLAPHYLLLQKVKPGITSWGQVKYGYAENIEQMVERLKYDLLYLENISLYIDFKIMIYTILTIFKGKGV